jgi:hypothetical protein
VIDFIYDIEVYPNVVTNSMLNVSNGEERQYEISHRRNDFAQMIKDMRTMRSINARMVGFNNYGYDYPVTHDLIMSLNTKATAEQIIQRAFAKSKAIINAGHHRRFDHIIWDNDQVVNQVDLYKIHHFDNNARATSLKILEFNMRSEDVQDLPFDPETELTDKQIDILLQYNRHDVLQTHKFYLKSQDHIQFREVLTEKYNRNFLNHNDTKIGKDFFVMQLEKSLGKKACYIIKDGKRQPRQTKRDQIHLRDVIFPYVEFERPEFNAVLDWLNRQTITETKGVFTRLEEDSLGSLAQYCDHKKEVGKIKNLNAIVDGMKFIFGTGGLHASVESTTVVSDEYFIIVDLDVTSYYPSLGICNRIYPQHLSPKFCDIYTDVKDQRTTYKKGSPENKMLKLALNGVYGDSNNQYSPFFDPQYTMAITINGQLLLCMLSESLMKVHGLHMIQANTDGITVILPRTQLNELQQRCSAWELSTGLDLEHACYSRMFIRDVNNYIAEYEDGKLKRKGAYEYELDWHQNHSSLVVQKAVEAHLVHDADLREFIENHDDIFDFFLRTKVPRSSKLMLRKDGSDTQIQNVTRYYISTNGGKLIKIMPPLKDKTEWREIGINKSWLATPCNLVDTDSLPNINFDFYVQEALKMVEPLQGVFEPIEYGEAA